jgi:hypothetical protein
VTTHSRELRDLLTGDARARLVDRLERALDFDRWGFHLAYVEPMNGPVIYNSPKCRVLFRLGMGPGGDEISSSYGRSHAPDDRSLLVWKGERCSAWHNLRVLRIPDFLEGARPEEVVKRHARRLHSPDIAAFMETGKSAGLSGAEGSVVLESFVWDRYGDRLFSLFDLRQQERWQALRDFVRSINVLQPEVREVGTEELFGILPWQIC